MAGQSRAPPALLLALAALVAARGAVECIQNDQTRSRSLPSEDFVLSASAYERERTSGNGQASGGSVNLQRTGLRLESSKSVSDVSDSPAEPVDETRYVGSPSSLANDVDDALTSSKLLDPIDGNQIEVKPGEYFRNIAPTRSERLSGEGRGAPQVPQDGTWSEPRQQQGHPTQPSSSGGVEWPGRQGRREPATIYSEHAPPPVLQQQRTQAAGPRQANPDIQDIITGIVKLLNGKVNVAVSSAKPVRPAQSTRINNRGPPRISDVRLPSDYDAAGMNPPPPPVPDQPATYETPPAPSAPSINQLPPDPPPVTPFINGIPLPEDLIPQANRPWNRPSKPATGTRRPVPAYKPLPAMGNASPQPDSDKSNSIEQGNRLEADEQQRNRTQQPSHSRVTSSAQRPQLAPTRKYTSTLRTDNNAISENTLVLGGFPPLVLPIPDANDTEPKPVVPLGNGAAIEKPKDPRETSSSTTNKAVFQTTLGIETSSSVQVIEATSTTTILEPSAAPPMHSDFSDSAPSASSSPSVESTPTRPGTPVLEPSRTSASSVDPSSSLSTPTEGLTSSLSKTTSVLYKPTNQPVTSSITFSKGQSSVYSYRPRPGIVLDDTLDYTGSQGVITQRPYAPPRHPPNPDTFDVVVSAIQGPGQSGAGEVRVPLSGGHGADDILTSPVEGQGFVSIDGKRTYLNLFDNTEGTAGPSRGHVQPTKTQNAPVIGTGYVSPHQEVGQAGISPRPTSAMRRPTFHKRPTQPPVRIDTCIVGDTSTCDASQHEACATVQGVSACHCKPGFARISHSLPCKRIVSIVVSIRVDKIYDRKMVWNKDLADKDSEFYQALSFEANRAIESAMSMTPFSDEYVGSLINNIYEGDVSQGQGGVFVNATLKLAYEPRTARQSVAGELQKHLLGVIQRRYNNIGNSALHVDGPAGSISNILDLDECASTELNDCHSSATCTNNWGGFVCNCKPGFKDPHKKDPTASGRACLSCSNSHCNNRGTCSYRDDQMQCSCTGSYYGAQCEIDGEVLGVAIGASVAALIIIILTLVCLIMWSRKWSREQKALSPVYGYVQGTLPGTLPARLGSVGTLASVKQGPPTNLPPYMWAQVADHLATANVYATEPMGPTRPSSAMFAYPTLSLHGTIPPVPLPRLQAPPRARQRPQPQPDPDSSDSEPQDKDRADLIPQSNFQAPRPKSRSSMANQSGIYYDVEYDQGDARHLSKNNIPMSTYSMAPYYRT